MTSPSALILALVPGLGDCHPQRCRAQRQPRDKDSNPIVPKLNWEVIPGCTGRRVGRKTGREGCDVGHGDSGDPWKRPELLTRGNLPKGTELVGESQESNLGLIRM